MNKILHGDCLELMADIPDGSVDMVLTDLPYGITACKWDKSILDFDALWKHWNRVCKPSAPVLLFASGIFTGQCMMSNPRHYKYKWVWEKSQPSNPANARKMPMRAHEDILVFYRKAPVYNPQMSQGHRAVAKDVANMRLKGEAYVEDNIYASTKESLGKGATREGATDRYPRDVQLFCSAMYEAQHGRGLRKSPHPTAKPVELCRYLIRTYTNPGDMVLDSTCGSGSTCLAAALEGRGYIGIELDPKYAATAVSRVNNLGAYEPTPRLDGI